MFTKEHPRVSICGWAVSDFVALCWALQALSGSVGPRWALWSPFWLCQALSSLVGLCRVLSSSVNWMLLSIVWMNVIVVEVKVYRADLSPD